MKCESPLRIRNQYTGDWLMVSCGHCDCCKIAKVNAKIPLLTKYISNFKYCYFVTLTYDNFHVPFVRVNDYYHIYTLDDGCIEYLDEPLYVRESEDSKLPRLNNHSFHDAVGVLYYRHVQLFLKRFRKYINKNYGKQKKFFYHLICEYGTDGKRPHYHILFLSDNLEYGQLQDSVLENWSLCDWNRLQSEECFKRANDAVSCYLSAYVNCTISNNPFYSDKRIRQKTVRSKDINFCIDAEVREGLQKFVSLGNDGFSIKHFKQACSKVETGRINVPIVDLSARILFAYFRKPEGFNKMDFSHQCRRIREILFRFASKIGRIDYFKVSSLDYCFVLSYRRFCELLNLNPFAYGTIEYYCFIFMQFHNLYFSYKLHKFMLNYVVRDSFDIDNYVLDCYNSFLYDLDVRRLRLIPKVRHVEYFKKMHMFSLSSRIALSEYKQVYKKRLVGKVLNSYLNKIL